jgi:hypothetical protein
VVKHLPCKHEALNSNPSTEKEKERKENPKQPRKTKHKNPS